MRSRRWMMVPFLMITLFSCVKDPWVAPGTKIRIDLQGAAVSGDALDSADLVLRQQGTVVKTVRWNLRTADRIEFWFRDVPTGTYTADIEMYTKTSNNKSLQYVLVKPVDLVKTDTTIVWTGPAAQPGNGWAKRHVKTTANNDIVVIVPDDVYDPYFEIRVRSDQWNAFQVERLCVQGSAVVAFKTWRCESGCDRRITNKDFFLPFTQTIGGKSWTENHISIAVGNYPKQEFVDFEHTWTK